MAKYSDEEIRQMSKITCKIAADYLGCIIFSVGDEIKFSLSALFLKKSKDMKAIFR